MSRIGKQQLAIPEKVDVTTAAFADENGASGFTATIKGPLGTLSRSFTNDITLAVKDGSIMFMPASSSVSGALWGTVAAHVSNMIEGVTKGYEKKLIIEGIGYRVEAAGTNLVFALGFSHPVKIAIPEGIKVAIEKNVLIIKGIDKDRLGQFAAIIVAHKKPEPYKGKGIMYEGQHIRRKQGKRSTA